MERRGVTNVGPIVAADQRTYTDSIFLIILSFYLIFWLFVGVYVTSKTHDEIGLADPEDDVAVFFETINHATSEQVKQLVGTGGNHRSLRIIVRNGLKKKDDKKEDEEKSPPITITEIIQLIAGAIFYIGLVVKLSTYTIHLLQYHPRFAVFVSIFFYYCYLVYLILDDTFKFIKALQLHHPSPSDHVVFLVYDVLFLVIVFVLTVIFSKKLNIVPEIVREGSKAVMSFTSWIYFVPVAELMFVIILEVVFGIVANSVLIMKDSTRHSFQGHVWFCQLYNLFGYLWLKSLISAAARIIISRMVAVYYWSDNSVKHFIASNALTECWKVTFGYHTGTAALGSAIEALVRWTGNVLKFVRTNIESKGKYSEFPVFEILKELSDLLVAVVMYINKNAYIMCAIHGTNFINSAKQAIDLIIKNLPLALITNCLTIFVIRVCLAVVTIVSVLITTLCISIFIGSLYTEIVVRLLLYFAPIFANIIFFVLQVAIETIFLSAMEDFDRNNGSAATEQLKNVMLNN